MGFEVATKKNSKARVCLMGPPGGGKTYTGLQILTEFGCKKICVIDSERGSARKYSDKFPFLVSEPLTFDPREYIKEIDNAIVAGADGLMLDSWSAVWSGKGGFLEKVDAMGGSSFSNGWKAMSPVFNQMVDKILTFPGHVVATLRVKTEYVVETNDKGKSAPKKVGLKPVQRDDAEYEFDYVLNLGQQSEVFVTKQRGCPDIEGLSTTRAELPRIITSMKTFLEIK